MTRRDLEELNMDHRAAWGSRLGFIMTTAGFAVGLGAIWRFPYMMSKNGGGAFLLVYLLATLVVGVPLFIAEIALGRRTRHGGILGMRRLTPPRSPFRLAGWLGVAAGIGILSYYSVILALLLVYWLKSLGGAFAHGTDPASLAAVFDAASSGVPALGPYVLAAVLLMGLVIRAGLKRGLERACKYLMPVLLLFLGLLAAGSLCLPGSGEGLAWFLKPDFGRINLQMALDALGHTFFAVGIGVSTAFVFGSYLSEKSNIVADALIITGINTAVSILAGLVIFPAMHAFGLNKAAGAGLIFETMPAIFAHMPGGWPLSAVFFFLLIISGFASGLGLVEGVVSALGEVLELGRDTTLALVLSAVLLLSLPTLLSYGEHAPWAGIRLWGRSIFVFIEYMVTALIMPVGALLTSRFVARRFGFAAFAAEANKGAGRLRVTRHWQFFVVIVAPGAVGIILLLGLWASLLK